MQRPAAAARQTTMMPLDGIRVLDITVVWAGPHCTQLLADWGAEVIRVESTQVVQPNTRGRAAWPDRSIPRMRKSWRLAYPDWDPGDKHWNRFPIFQSHGRNKLSMTVDIRRPEGLELFKQMLGTADVLVENNVPETIEKLHLTYEELVKIKPDLVMLRMPAYGLDGPYKNFRSFGSQMECTAGHTWIRGYSDMDPSVRDDVFLGDAAGGASGAFSVLAALRHRRRTGEGQLIELAQAENFLPYLGETVLDYTMNGRVQTSLGNRHPYMAPHGVYRCEGEDRWVAIAVSSDDEWRGLCLAMGNPQWCLDARFSTALGRWKHQEALDDYVQDWTQQRKPSEAMQLLQARGVPAGAVMDDSDLSSDPQMEEQGFFQLMEHEDTGAHSYPGLMWAMANTPNFLRLPPCRLGEHNRYVYNDLLGLGDKAYEELEEAGHIGTELSSNLS